MFSSFLSTPQSLVKRYGQIFFLKAIEIIIILILSYLAYHFTSWLITRYLKLRLKESKAFKGLAAQKRTATLFTLFRNLLKYFTFFVCAYMIIEIILKGSGISMASILAGAGIAGLAIGFGAQTLVRDLVAGFFILFEGQFAVGDFVYLKAGPYEAKGIVEDFGLRATKVRDLSGSLHYIPNGSITGVEKFSKGWILWLIDLYLPRGIKESKLKEVISDLASFLIKRDSFLLNFQFRDLFSLPSHLVCRLEIRMIPSDKGVLENWVKLLIENIKRELNLKKEIFYNFYPFEQDFLEKQKKLFEKAELKKS